MEPHLKYQDIHAPLRRGVFFVQLGNCSIARPDDWSDGGNWEIGVNEFSQFQNFKIEFQVDMKLEEIRIK